MTSSEQNMICSVSVSCMCIVYSVLSACTNRTFGIDCLNQCNQVCYNDADCNFTDGSCVCQPGFLLPNCSERKHARLVDEYSNLCYNYYSFADYPQFSIYT